VLDLLVLAWWGYPLFDLDLTCCRMVHVTVVHVLCQLCFHLSE
jgi:hypothetical protein